MKRFGTKLLPLIPVILCLFGWYFVHIAFTASQNMGFGIGFAIMLTISISMFASAVLLNLYSSFFRLEIFDFNREQGEDIPAVKYALLFFITHVAFALIADGVYGLFGREWTSIFLPVIVSSCVVAYLFVLKYKRLMTKKERNKIIVNIMVTSGLIGGWMIAFLLAIGEISSPLPAYNLLSGTILILISAIGTYVLQLLVYGVLSKRIYMTHKNKKKTEDVLG